MVVANSDVPWGRVGVTEEETVIQTECHAMAKQLVQQFDARFVPESGQSECALRTPFFYPDNTPIVMFVRTEAEKIIVSDHGQASDYAFLNGAETAEVMSRIDTIARGRGIAADDDDLVTEVEPDALATAVLAVAGAAREIGNLASR